MGTTTLALIFASVSQTFSLPTGLLSALCFVESSHRVNVVHLDDGGSNSVGICEIKLSTAKEYGFNGTEQQLKDPKINIHYAGAYLRHQLSRYGGDIAKGTAAYNAGSCRLNGRGLIKNRKYVHKVFSAWEAGR